MKKIEVTVQRNDGTLTVDLGGDLDGSCCGIEARQLNEALKELGVETKLQRISCRLSPLERLAAKREGQCGESIGEILRHVAQNTRFAKEHRDRREAT